MRLVLILVPLGVAVFLTGLWIGHRMGATTEPTSSGLPVTDAGTPSKDQEIVRSIAALADQIKALRDQIGSRSTASETRAPADGRASELDKLAQAVQQLNERLDAMRRTSAASPSGFVSLRDPEKSPGFASREDLLRELDQLYRQEATADENTWSKILNKETQRWQSIHMLWSVSEMIERYGHPDLVEDVERGPIFQYTRTSADGRHQGVVFYTRNGWVYRLETYSRDP